jgi:DNA replication and repair protein RecF
VFSSSVNCILGENGSGKTNLLDAVYFLALSKSSIQSQDQLSVKHGEDFMLLEGHFEKLTSAELITISMQRGQRKTLLHDKKAYEKNNEHIGKYPVVLIAPDDTDLIRDSAETRRKLFDGIISQLNQAYLSDYIAYNRALDQRNSILKQFAERNYFDKDLLEIYSQSLIKHGIAIQEFRNSFMNNFLPVFSKHYAELSEDREQVNIRYESEVSKESFALLIQNHVKSDLAAQRTTKGIHKDDYVFSLGDFPIKKYGSQGQKKSFVMAIRMAQFEIMEKQNGLKPILLLDDIFDKLDDRRIQKLIEAIDNEVFGQVFISDARPERTKELLKNLRLEVNYIDR